MIKLPKIYPITNVELSGLSHADQVRDLADSGCRFLQIREKTRSSREIFDTVVESVSIANSVGMKIIVNDRVDIALAARAHGVHLGQDDLPPSDARKLLGSEAIIGYSTHSVEQAIEAIKLPVDYVAIGPIFDTSTKQSPDPVVGFEGLLRVREAVGSFPLVAIGGIKEANLASVFAAGADSAALISTLFIGVQSIGSRYSSLAKK